MFKDPAVWLLYAKLHRSNYNIKFLREQGLNEDEIQNWYVSHTKLDKPTSVERQLDWLRSAGFEDVDCVWKYYNLAVYFGFKK